GRSWVMNLGWSMRGNSSTKLVDDLSAPAVLTVTSVACDKIVFSLASSDSRESALVRHCRSTRSRYSQKSLTMVSEFSGKYFLQELRARDSVASSSISVKEHLFSASSTTTLTKSGIQPPAPTR